MPTTTHHNRRAIVAALASLMLLGAALVTASPAAADDHECYADVLYVEWHELLDEGSEGVKEYLWQHKNFAQNGLEEWLPEGELPNQSHNWTIVDERWETVQPSYGSPEWYPEDEPPVGAGWEHTTNPPTTDLRSVEVECEDEGDFCEENPQAEECLEDEGDFCEENPQAEECLEDEGDFCEENPQAEECLEDEGDFCEENPQAEECLEDEGDFCEENPRAEECLEEIDPCELEQSPGLECEDDDPQVGGIVIINQTTTSTTEAPRAETEEPTEQQAPIVLDLEEEPAGPDTNVASAGATLPRTGASSLTMLFMALGMMTGGFSLTQFARRND
jgi:hypothetical protein